MNKLKLIPIIALVLPLLSIFTPVNSVFTNKLCAGTTVDGGVACIDNATVCPTGYKVAKEFFSGISLTQMRSQQVQDSFAASYPDGLRTMCISTTFSAIIPVYTASHKVDDGPGGQNIHALSESGSPALDTVRVPRACPSGWHADQGNYSLSTLGIPISEWREPWGCCPSGYNFINTKNQTFPDGYQVGACVKNTIRADYLATEGGASGNGIYAADGTKLIGFDASASYVQYPSWTDLKAGIAKGDDYIYSYRNSAGNVVQPQIGQGLGGLFKDLNLDGENPRVRTGPAITGAPKKCPANTACALTVNPAQGATNPDLDRHVVAGSFETGGNTDLCSRCYTAGDTMGTSGPPNGLTSPTPGVDNTIGFVRYCNADGSVKDETLLGTPDITRGYLLEDETNKALYKQCVETGGIYTAIGCVDPTPTGIITGIIRIALGVMGGVALLQLIYVGILYQQGDQEKIKGARTQLIATITGIAVLVFSVLILRIIGVNILDTVSNGSV